MAWQKFEGRTSFIDSHETIQGIVGNATWFNEYVPWGEDRIAEVMAMPFDGALLLNCRRVCYV